MKEREGESDEHACFQIFAHSYVLNDDLRRGSRVKVRLKGLERGGSVVNGRERARIREDRVGLTLGA